MSEQKVANRIRLQGCDDENEIWFEMTVAEADFLTRLATALNDARKYGCNPGVYLNGEYPSTPEPDGENK